MFPVDKLGTSQNTPPDKAKKCYQGVSRPESNNMGTFCSRQKYSWSLDVGKPATSFEAPQ
jgi:hypothetical protein